MDIKKNKAILIAAMILAVILAVVICLFAGQRPSQPAVPTVGPGAKPVQPSVSTRPAQPTESTEPTIVPETTEPVPPETVTQPTQPTQSTVPPTEPVTEPEEDPIPETTVPVGVRFPYVIPGTELVIEAVNPYSGVFLEDGSDRDANDVCAIVLHNMASTCAEYINITLTRDDGVELIFTASAIDVGSTVVVMEYNGEEYQEMDYVDCTADVAQITHLEMSEDLIHVEENEDGSLAVTNISGADIPCVRIFYKFYLDDVDVYVGGITYTAKLEHLAAGETRNVTPSHYAQNNSRIVMVKAYDTVE